MNIVVALDSFKGSLTAPEACRIVAETIRHETTANVILRPLADGGEGTADALLVAREGCWISRQVMGPLEQMKADAGFAWFQDEKTALVEMATASGITLLRSDQLNPMKTTTYGTGQLIKAAADYGAETILLALGGSATVDGGTGAAAALGWQILDEQGGAIPLGGTGLTKIAEIRKPAPWTLPPVQILCDVTNPLCGDNGAARIYGPQKGADPEMVEDLEKGLLHFSDIVKRTLGREINNLAGAGAAGGFAAGAVAFMNGRIVSGIDTIIREIDLKNTFRTADWVITGEGAFDHQSLMGKVVSGVSLLAKATNTRTAVLAGQVLIPENEYRKHGIEYAIGCKDKHMSLDDAIENCRQLLAERTRELLRLID